MLCKILAKYNRRLTSFKRTRNTANKNCFSRVERHRSVENKVSVTESPGTYLHLILYQFIPSIVILYKLVYLQLEYITGLSLMVGLETHK